MTVQGQCRTVHGECRTVLDSAGTMWRHSGYSAGTVLGSEVQCRDRERTVQDSMGRERAGTVQYSAGECRDRTGQCRQGAGQFNDSTGVCRTVWSHTRTVQDTAVTVWGQSSDCFG